MFNRFMHLNGNSVLIGYNLIGLPSKTHFYNGNIIYTYYAADGRKRQTRYVYDPAVGRFTIPDPLAWDTPWLSPYVYCAANPIRYIDPTGLYSVENLDDNTNYRDSNRKLFYNFKRRHDCKHSIQCGNS